MKKKYLLIIIVIVIIGLILFNNRFTFTNKEISKLNSIKKGLVINDLLVINKIDTDYYEYKNIKINNNYDCIEKEKLICKRDNKKLQVSIEDTYLSLFKKYNKTSSKIIKKYNIKTDLELFGKIKEINNKKLFNNKEEYLLNKYTLKYIDKAKNIDLIEGDISGLLFNYKDYKELLIENNNKLYRFKFINMNSDEINEIMNSIVID